MTFLSLYFFLFLFLSVAVFYLLPAKLRPVLIAVVSIGFYLLWNVGYALLLILVTLIIYWTALNYKKIAKENREFRVIMGIVGLLILILGFFKYFNFFSRSIFQLFNSVNPEISGKPFLLDILIPIGISYYTFKAISYLMDCYWEKIEPENNFIFLFAHISFFPQIISGPVQRAKDFLPQIKLMHEGTQFKYPLFESGLKLILWGLFKKLVVADNLADYVTGVHNSPENFKGFYSLLACWFFSFQLYADFSGITDMAIGFGRLFGIRTPQNFNRPFYASNVQEFWRRWHITLTTWLTDYVFTPLRMQFRSLGSAGIVLSILVNMVAIGVWHGAAWTFVMFGFIHAVLMILSYFSLNRRNKIYARLRIPGQIRKLIGIIITFNIISLTLNLFRAASLEKAWMITVNIFTASSIQTSDILLPLHQKTGILLILLFLILESFTSISKDPFDENQIKADDDSGKNLFVRVRKIALLGFIGAMILSAGNFGGAEFIYEQF